MGKVATKTTSFLLTLFVVFSICGAAHILLGATNAYAADGEGGAKAAGDTTYLAFTSDVHNGTTASGSSEANVSANRLTNWLNKVQPMYNNAIEVMGFCGDMGAASSNQNTFWTFTQTVLDRVADKDMTSVLAVGNHEYMNGQFATTSSGAEVRARYKLNEEGRAVASENYVMYCLGTNSSHGTSWAYDDSQITELTNYLNSVSNDKVIIILTHFPLHDYGSHRTSNTVPVLNAINEAAVGADGRYGTSDDKKIVFLWGHNHSEGDNNYDQVWFPGDQINDNNKSTVYFYYAAAGCMADAEYGSSAKVLGKGLVLEIDNQQRLSFTYYDANANNVTEPDGETVSEIPQEPVAIQGVSITNSSLTVKAGKTLQLKYATTPTKATVDTVSWSSNKTSVATVDSNGKVTGVSEGTATITLTISDGLSKNTVSTSTTITVAAAGTSEEFTTEITPSTSNPEQTINIEVGDTLTITATNGSSSSAYDFTASLSKSGIAEIQGNATQNIAAGSSAAYTFEGVADGRVDITIQNTNQYGSQYVRKATIHLIVGDGGGDDPIPTGDTVNITPSTDNPEETIKIAVGDTIAINVTNGSSNSAYDFTASLSKTGIAQIEGNSTINIGMGSVGQFTVTGLTDGKVDITIQNNSSYGSQYVRKGIVHLIVGDGGGDDPIPTGDTVNITPSTDNPEETIKIAVGDTLTINVKNGSSNSAYDFTATLNKSGIAEIQGNSTVNIDMGATGQFVVKGLADGKVDITIQNENSYGSQYVRKGIVHLIVGDGGGDDPIPTGDTVNITPTTDNPEESISIAVGDTLTINVTNGSSNSAYNYTASLSNSGIAEITSTNPLNIGMGSVGQFTVKGLAKGTVDITIQNENQYGSQYVRKGVVHLTVTDGSAVHTHTWNDGVVTTAATCTAAGVKTFTCTGCGETKTETIPATGHTAVAVAGKAATCTEAGLTDGTKCSVCGEILSGQQTIPALGHTAVAVAGKAATCTESGLTEGSKCSVCGETLVAQQEIPALGHNFGEWVKTKDPTCTEPGVETSTCSRCGATETREIAALGHSFGSPVVTKMPTCTEEGVMTSTCSVCGETNEMAIAALGHTWNAPTYTPVKGEDGSYTGITAERVCSACGATETETAGVKKTETVDPTETEDGSITYIFEDFENAAFSSQFTIVILPATGHQVDYENIEWVWTGNDVDGYTSVTATAKCVNFDTDNYYVDQTVVPTAVTTNPTCTVDGATVWSASVAFDSKIYTDTKTIAIPALGHKAGEAVQENVVAATCTEAGSYEMNVYCTVCGEKLSGETFAVEALGHKASEPVQENVVAAKCTETGSYEEVVKCTVCGEEISRTTVEVAALGHDFGAWRTMIPATCTEKGAKIRYCNVCFAEERQEIEAFGHTWDEGKVTTEPTSEKEGVKTFTCKTCGEKKTESIAKVSPSEDKTKVGEDGTALGPGASAAAAEAAILGMTNDGDPKGSNYLPLELQSKKQTNNSITIKWVKQAKATKYVVYGNLCGKSNKMAKICEVKGSKASKKLKKIAGKKLKAGKAYKIIIVALDKDGMVVSTSKLIHVVAKGGKNTNHKSVTVKQGGKVAKSLTAKKGGKVTITAEGVKAQSKLKYSTHVKIRYCSSDPKIAKVNKKGVVSAKKAGTCYIYAYSQNGVAKKVKLTVK